GRLRQAGRGGGQVRHQRPPRPGRGPRAGQRQRLLQRCGRLGAIWSGGDGYQNRKANGVKTKAARSPRRAPGWRARPPRRLFGARITSRTGFSGIVVITVFFGSLPLEGPCLLARICLRPVFLLETPYTKTPPMICLP